MTFDEAFHSVVGARGRRTAWPPYQFAESWRRFVEEAVSGYNGDLYEYENELTVRDDIDRALGDRRLAAHPNMPEFQQQIEATDERFRSLLVLGPEVRAGAVWWRARIPKSAGAEFAEDAVRLFGVTIEVV